MRKRISIFLLFFILSLPTEAILPLVHIDAHIGLDFGGHKQKEEGNKFEHESWNYGLELGGRLGLDISILYFGGLYNIGKYHFDNDRTDTEETVNNVHGYNNSIETHLSGGFAGVKFPFGLRCWGEYYSRARSKITYAGPKGANPYKEGDHLEGSGFGAGIGFSYKVLYLGLMFRSVKYDKFGLEGSNTTANTDLNKFTHNSMSFQVGLTF